MQIQLEPEVEDVLVAESAALGLTPAELSAQVLSQRFQPREKISDAERIEFIEKYIAHMKAANPNYESHDPYSVDWQAIKAEGRKY